MIVLVLFALAAGAWIVTIEHSNSTAMSGGAMGAGLFFLTWIVMTIAMMFPSVAPMTLAFGSITHSRGQGYLPTAAFVAGYLAVWIAAGLIPLGFMRAIDALWMMTTPPWLGRAAGAVIIAAGLYQVTPLKDVCLRACRSPLGFLMTHDYGRGPYSAVRAGAAHGVYCLGCCWALMALLVVLGLMNLAWMAGISAIFFIEKNLRFGDLLPRAVGVSCVAGGLAVIFV